MEPTAKEIEELVKAAVTVTKTLEEFERYMELEHIRRWPQMDMTEFSVAVNHEAYRIVKAFYAR